MTTATSPIASRFRPQPPRRQGLGPEIVGLAAVLLLAPLVAIIVNSGGLQAAGIVAAAVTILLIVLWSAEATFYLLVFSMLLSPEFIVGGLADAGGALASRGITLRLDDYLISIIALAWLVRLAVYKEAAVFRRTPLNAPIAAYIGFSILSTLLGALAGRLTLVTGFFYVLKYFEYMVIYLLVVNYVRDRDQVRRLLTAAIATAIIISVIAIIQIPTGQRVSAPFEGEQGEPNTLGGYLVLMMALGLSLLSEARTARARIGWGAAIATMALPLVYTYSRTSWLAFCAMLATLIAISHRKTLFLILTGVFLVILIVSPPEAILERASYTLSSQRNSIQVLGFTIEPSAGARLVAWGSAAEAIALYPIFGAGVTGYGLIDAQYPRTLAEIGVIGLGLFAWLLSRMAATGFALRALASTKTESVLAAGFIAGLAGMVVHGIGANTFTIVRIMEPLWLLTGLVGASLIIHEAEGKRSQSS